MDEWKYSSGILYMAVYGHIVGPTRIPDMMDGKVVDSESVAVMTTAFLTNGDGGASVGTITVGLEDEGEVYSQSPCAVRCQLAVTVYDPAVALGEGAMARYKLFVEIYRDIDGAGLSLRNRLSLGISDHNYNYSYSEIEYLSFQNLLKVAGANDGQIMYDLGSGIGKAVVAAALSGIKFMRCVGFEILPILHENAVQVINEVKRCMQSRSITGAGGNGGSVDSESDRSRGNYLSIAAASLNVGLPLMDVR